jgi:hypothetical protein
VSGAAIVQRAREMLRAAAPSAAFVCGTSRSFDVLESDPPDAGGADAVVFSVSGNTIDLGEQGRMVRSALALLAKPVVVSSVAMREETAARVQWELAGAAWTVASVKQLLEAGACSFSYFDAIGPRGVVAADGEGASTDQQVSPIYHVLADLGDWRTTVLVHSTSSDPLTVETLVVRSERGAHALIANLTGDAQPCSLPSPAGSVGLRALEECALADALGEPEAYREARTTLRVDDALLHVELSPYSVLRIDPAPQR